MRALHYEMRGIWTVPDIISRIEDGSIRVPEWDFRGLSDERSDIMKALLTGYPTGLLILRLDGMPMPGFSGDLLQVVKALFMEPGWVVMPDRKGPGGPVSLLQNGIPADKTPYWIPTNILLGSIERLKWERVQDLC